MAKETSESGLRFTSVTLEALPGVAREILRYGGDCRLYLLEGSPGSGKTTLIQMMLRQLGVQDPVTSPTFALVQLYRNEAGQRFAHLDLYRIKSAAEAEEAGLNEILQEPYDKIFVEWPSRVPEFFENLNAVIIVFESDGERRTFKVKRRKIL